MATTTTKPNAGVQTPPLTEAPADNLPAMRPRSSGSSMAVLPQNWQEITAIAGAICRARMAPKSYCDKDGNPQAEKVAIAIMHGLEVGFTPMASLQSLAVINGMPSVFGDGLLALIKASGLLEDIEETMEWDKNGPLAATCKMWRRGEKTPSTQTYAREDAMKAGLWGKQGPWTQHPARMLQWRARGWCGRDKFPDVLRGLHSAEEAQDMVDVTPQGSATVGKETPPEPTRETAVADNNQGSVAGTSADAGRAANSPPAAGGSDRKADAFSAKPEAAATPAHDPETGEIKTKPANGRRTRKKPDATDVTDQNAHQPAATTPPEGGQAQADPQPPAEPITFEPYNRPGDFFTFSDGWIEQSGRTVVELEQWHAFYAGYMQKLKAQGSQGTKDAVDDTLKIYGRVMAKLLPPEE